MSANFLVAIQPDAVGTHVWEKAQLVADPQGAELQLINVVEPAVSIYADLNFAPLVECAADWQKELVKAHQSFLQDLAPKGGCVSEGNPSHEIATAAEKGGADLIVMGLHNRRGLQKLLGSTTHAVLNHTQTDLLAVHPDSTNEPYRRVLIALDTQDTAAGVLSRAKPYIDNADDIRLVNVMMPLTNVFAAPETAHALDWNFEELTKDIQTQTQKKLSLLAQDFNLDPSKLELRTGDARDEIVAAAKSWQADLIVIGAHNRNLLNRVLLGSTTRGVLDQAPCDVFVCRPDEVS